MIIARSALAIAFAVLPTIASAGEPGAMTAGELQSFCTGSDHVSKNVCRMYILGITQGISIGMAIADGNTKGGRPCVPEDISGEALELAVNAKLGADLTAFPADRDLDASGVISAVLISTFPCEKKHQ